VLLLLIILLQHRTAESIGFRCGYRDAFSNNTLQDILMYGWLVLIMKEEDLGMQMHFQQFATGAILGLWIAFSA
jgi:hypothetical protein